MKAKWRLASEDSTARFITGRGSPVAKMVGTLCQARLSADPAGNRIGNRASVPIFGGK